MNETQRPLQELSTIISNTDAVSDLSDMDRDSQSIILQQERYASDTKHRLWLAWTIVIVIIVWLAIVVVILMLNNLLFHLSDPVLIALLGTSTATVLGLPAIVLKGFFQFMNQTTDLNRFTKDKHEKR